MLLAGFSTGCNDLAIDLLSVAVVVVVVVDVVVVCELTVVISDGLGACKFDD